MVINGRACSHGVIEVPGSGKLPVHEVLQTVLPGLACLLERYGPDTVVVEQVTWYGRARRITLPLSHVAGGIAGYVLAAGANVYLLQASQRLREIPPSWQKWPTDHERDAAALAIVVHQHLHARTADGVSTPPKPSAVLARIITAPPNAPTSG